MKHPSIEQAVHPVLGSSVPRPKGTLAGHAAGLPFEREVHKRLVANFSGRCFRHFEALNRVLADHPNANSLEDRMALFGPPDVRALVARGASTTASWAPHRPFEEKQDDTAESILFPDSPPSFWSHGLTLIDVKTQNLDKASRPPNIISAGKLMKVLEQGLMARDIPYDIVYVGVAWRVSGQSLVCENICVKSLFRIEEPLYINWVAAQQVQFHPFSVDQDFSGTRIEWAKLFLERAATSLEGKLRRDRERLDYVWGVIRNMDG